MATEAEGSSTKINRRIVKQKTQKNNNDKISQMANSWNCDKKKKQNKILFERIHFAVCFVRKKLLECDNTFPVNFSTEISHFYIYKSLFRFLSQCLIFRYINVIKWIISTVIFTSMTFVSIIHSNMFDYHFYFSGGNAEPITLLGGWFHLVIEMTKCGKYLNQNRHNFLMTGFQK